MASSTSSTSLTCNGECGVLVKKQNGRLSPSIRGEDTESPSSTQHDTENSFTYRSFADDSGGESGDEDAIEQAYETIRNRSQGGLLSPDNRTFYFSHGQQSYERLYSRLDKAGLLRFFEDCVRTDWNADTGELTLRLMQLYLHELFQDFFGSAIQKEMDRIAEEHPSLRTVRNKILSGSHGSLRCFNESRVPSHQKSPDGQLIYEGGKLPHFLFEVAYSEREHNLLAKVNEYFMYLTPVSTILAFDIEYAAAESRSNPNHVHHASFSLWTSTETDDDITVECLIKNQVFRDQGRAVPGELVIPFTLLLPFGERRKLPRDVQDHAQARFSFETLSQFLKRAEDQERVLEEPARPVVQKKRRFLDVDGSLIGDTLLPAPEPKRPRTVAT
ncbi:hypothetical protein F4859DRAFT_523215 [Xylaria cf. heliscus]|nr:hypothetical protein F4859DRAFT_523215 [Xylaria cf. heliscus]